MPRASPRTGGCNPAVGFAQGGRASGAGADGENGMLSCQECHGCHMLPWPDWKIHRGSPEIKSSMGGY